MKLRATFIGFTAILMWSFLALFTAASGKMPPFQLSAMCFAIGSVPGLVVLIDQRAVLAGRVGVDSECVDPEVLAHRNISAAPLDVVEVRDFPVRLVVHPITSV